MINELFKIIGLSLLTLIVYIILKPIKPEIAFLVSIIGICVVLANCVDGIVKIIDTMTQFVQKTGVDSTLFACVLKIVGIGYITEFSSNLCITAGNTSIADVISLAGKITILVLSLPILSNLLELLIQILP